MIASLICFVTYRPKTAIICGLVVFCTIVFPYIQTVPGL